MSATILDGRAAAQQLRELLMARFAAFQAEYRLTPCLAVIHILGDAPAERYLRSIRKQCQKMGAAFRLVELPADVSQADLETTLDQLSADPTVHGILLQLPLPPARSLQAAVLHLDHRKDVDGIHPTNAGLLAQGEPTLVANPPAAGMALFEHYGIDLSGAEVAMVGWGTMVGRPMTSLLLRAGATVTVCHSLTRDLAAITRRCTVVVVAVGKAGLITGEMLQPGAVVVDFGINVQPDGSVVGDVDFASASQVASAITPVPGGTGPLTNLMLLRNVLTAAQELIAAD